MISAIQKSKYVWNYQGEEHKEIIPVTAQNDRESGPVFFKEGPQITSSDYLQSWMKMCIPKLYPKYEPEL